MNPPFWTLAAGFDVSGLSLIFYFGLPVIREIDSVCFVVRAPSLLDTLPSRNIPPHIRGFTQPRER